MRVHWIPGLVSLLAAAAAAAPAYPAVQSPNLANRDSLQSSASAYSTDSTSASSIPGDRREYSTPRGGKNGNEDEEFTNSPLYYLIGDYEGESNDGDAHQQAPTEDVFGEDAETTSADAVVGASTYPQDPATDDSSWRRLGDLSEAERATYQRYRSRAGSASSGSEVESVKSTMSVASSIKSWFSAKSRREPPAESSRIAFQTPFGAKRLAARSDASSWSQEALEVLDDDDSPTKISSKQRGKGKFALRLWNGKARLPRSPFPDRREDSFDGEEQTEHADGLGEMRTLKKIAEDYRLPPVKRHSVFDPFKGE